MVKIKNTGKLAGDKVVLLFAKRKETSLPLFTTALVGFARVSLKPGEEKEVSLEVKSEQLSYWNDKMKFIEDPGGFIFEAEGKSGTINVTK